MYLAVTSIVFAGLLSGTDVDTAIPWVNTVLHHLFPIVAVADWTIDPPADRATIRRGLLWLVYPIGWIGWTMARGGATGWYPYPFLNPEAGGFASVAWYLAAIVGLGVAVCGGIVAIGNAQRGSARGQASRLRSYAVVLQNVRAHQSAGGRFCDPASGQTRHRRGTAVVVAAAGHDSCS